MDNKSLDDKKVAEAAKTATNPNERQYGAGYKLIGKNYETADLYAKVTGNAKYAEDFRADGMLFCKLLLSPMPHARVRRMDTRAALAMPGVKAILTADDLPAPADTLTDNGTVIKASKWGERGLTMEPVYQGEPILAVAAVDELTAAEAIEKIEIDFEPLPFVNRRQHMGAAGGARVATCFDTRSGSACGHRTQVDQGRLRRGKARSSSDGQDSRRMVLWRSRFRVQECGACSG